MFKKEMEKRSEITGREFLMPEISDFFDLFDEKEAFLIVIGLPKD